MIVVPQWRVNGFGLGCQRAQWTPEPRFAAYLAPRQPLTLQTYQTEDEFSSSSCCSSPEHSGGEGASVDIGECETERVCEWRGCGLHVVGVTRLSTHLAREHAHAQQDGLFYCGWRGCGRPHRGFNARYKMLVHVRTHTNEKPHACPQCNKCFSRAENLKIHMRSHSGEKPYACPFEGCNKAYSNSSDRFKHTRTHAVDKPYCCKVQGCDKRYTDPSSLRKHVKTYKHFAPTSHSPDSSTDFTEQVPPVVQVSPERSTYRHERVTPMPVPNSVSILTGNISHEDRIRVPAYDMSYIEYSRLYNSSIQTLKYKRPLTENLYGKNYVILGEEEVLYREKAYNDSTMTDMSTMMETERVTPEAESPLNLQCSYGSEEPKLRVRSIEDSMEFQLVRAMEMPLDLSKKS